MPKSRDLLDYVSLGAQLVETANTSAIRDHLGDLARFEAEKFDAAQREASARQRETKVRDFVFDAMKVIDTMKVEAVKNDPRRSLVLFFELRRYVERFGITTTAVRENEDKERVHSFLTTLKEVIADCQGRLDAGALEQAEKCEKFKAEKPELDELIEFEGTKAHLDALNAKLEELGPISKRTVPVQVSGSVIYCGILAVVFAAIRGFDQTDSYTSVSLVLSFILIPIGILLYCSKTPPAPEALQIQSEIDTENRLLMAITDGTAPDDWASPLKSKFGDGDVETLKKVAADRDAFVCRIMKREQLSEPDVSKE